MEVAAQVLDPDQAGKPALGRGLDLAAVLAHLGGDPGEAHGGVDVRLLAAGDEFALFLLVPFLDPEDAVLGDAQALLDRPAAELDVVLLGAGEVDQSGAVALAGHHPQVHLEPRAEDDRAPRVAGHQDLVHLGIAAEALHDRDGLGGDGEEVDVPHGLPAAAVAAGHLQALHLGDLAQVGERAARRSARPRQQERGWRAGGTPGCRRGSSPGSWRRSRGGWRCAPPWPRLRARRPS